LPAASAGYDASKPGFGKGFGAWLSIAGVILLKQDGFFCTQFFSRIQKPAKFDLPLSPRAGKASAGLTFG
jgi:hypothetical protein